MDHSIFVMDPNIFVMEPNIFVMNQNIFVMDLNIFVMEPKLRYHTILLTNYCTHYGMLYICVVTSKVKSSKPQV
jgi:hypothetical protein